MAVSRGSTSWRACVVCISGVYARYCCAYVVACSWTQQCLRVAREFSASTALADARPLSRRVCHRSQHEGGRAKPRTGFEKDYVVGKRLGSGSYSTVRDAVCVRTKESVAVKIVTKVALTQEDLDALYVEVDVLRKVRFECLRAL